MDEHRTAIKNLTSILPLWGSVRSPLLPRLFRNHYANRVIQERYLIGSGLSVGVRYGDLGPDIWSQMREFTGRLRSHLHSFVVKHVHQVTRYRVVTDPGSLSSVITTDQPDNNLDEILNTLTWGDVDAPSGCGVETFLRLACGAESLECSVVVATEDYDGVLSRILAVRENSILNDVLLHEQRITSPELRGMGDGTLRQLVGDLPRVHHNARVLGLLEQAENRLVQVLYEHDLSRSLSELVAEFSMIEPLGKKTLLPRYGWLGHKPLTQQEVGSQLDITARRVSDIQEKFEKRYGHRLILPVLDEALRFLFDMAPISAEQAAALIVERGISSRPLDPAGILEAARIWQRQSLVSIETINHIRIVVPAGGTRLIREILVHGRRMSYKFGTVSWRAIMEQLHNSWSLSPSVWERIINRAMSCASDFTFDQDSEVWLYKDLPENKHRVLIHLTKMLSVANSLSLTSVREGLRRVARQRRIASVPSTEVLKLTIASLEGFVVEGDNVRATTRLLNREHLTDSDQVIINLFEKQDRRLLSRDEILECLIANGIRKDTVENHMSWTPILEQHSLGLWMLRGRPPSQEEIEKTSTEYWKRRRSSDAVTLGCWRISPSVTETAFRVSRAMARTGIVGIPSAFSQLPPKGRYAVKRSDNETLRMVDSWPSDKHIMFSMKLLFQDMRLKEDDIIIVRVDGRACEISARRSTFHEVKDLSRTRSKRRSYKSVLVERLEQQLRICFRITPKVSKQKYINAVRFRSVIEGKSFAHIHNDAVAQKRVSLSEENHVLPIARILKTIGAVIGDDVMLEFDLHKNTVSAHIANSPRATLQ